MKAKKPVLQLPYPKEINTIGDHIRKRRLDLDLFQKDVAHLIGVDETTVYFWEKNKSEPGIRHMPAIFDFLGYCLFVPAKTFSEKLMAHRRHLGLSQKQLAKRLNIDASTIASWERGETRPTKRSSEKVQNFFNTCGVYKTS